MARKFGGAPETTRLPRILDQSRANAALSGRQGLGKNKVAALDSLFSDLCLDCRVESKRRDGGYI